MSTRNKGFTLVELLVVIAIIGILATLVLLQLGSARSKARDTQRITAVSQIKGAVEQYFDDNNAYPTAITDAILGKYFSNSKVPVDPIGAAVYDYCANVATGKYQIAAQLENKATAINSDSDFLVADVGATSGTCLDGTVETCGTRAACIYDLGVK